MVPLYWYSNHVEFPGQVVDTMPEREFRFFYCGENSIYVLGPINTMAKIVEIEGYNANIDCKITQVNQDLYLYDGNIPSLTCYSNLNMLNGTNTKSVKAPPFTKRGAGYAISTFKE